MNSFIMPGLIALIFLLSEFWSPNKDAGGGDRLVRIVYKVVFFLLFCAYQYSSGGIKLACGIAVVLMGIFVVIMAVRK